MSAGAPPLAGDGLTPCAIDGQPRRACGRVVEAVRCYSVAEAAEHLGMSRAWLYDRIREGALPVVEFGDTRAKTRIRADHLQVFVDERTHPAPLRDVRPCST